MEVIAAPMLALLLFVPHASVQDREELSTVTIVGDCVRDCTRGNTVFGAGVIVERKGAELVVVTARHVIEAMRAPRIYLQREAGAGTPLESYRRNEGGHPATLLSTSDDSDLALVAFRPAWRDLYATASLATGPPPKLGSIVGHPYGKPWTVSHFAFSDAMANGFVVRCVGCGPGDSGGGTFDAYGRLCGIVVSEQRISRNGEPPAFAEPTGRFAVVPMGQVRALVAFGGRKVTEPQRTDAWERFTAVDRSRAGPWSGAAWRNAPRNDAWTRFANSTRGGSP